MRCPKCPNKTFFAVNAWSTEAHRWHIAVDEDGVQYDVQDERHSECCESGIFPTTTVACDECGHEGTLVEFGSQLPTEKMPGEE